LAQLENRITDLRLNWGINVVAAVGNSAGEVGYPARFPAALGVGATDASGGFCSFSSRGEGLDVSTLGCVVELSWPGGGLGAGSGTSYSAPAVSAILAAMRSYAPGLTADGAENLLQSTATASSSGPHVNAAAAFRQAGLTELTNLRPPGTMSAVPPDSPGQAVFSGGRFTDLLGELGVRRPQLRSCVYRRGILTIRVSGVPDYGRAIFQVDGRRYVRSSGTLRVRLRRAPRQVTVFTDVRGIGRTSLLRVPLRRFAQRASGVA
jgi:hypothetical protein